MEYASKEPEWNLSLALWHEVKKTDFVLFNGGEKSDGIRMWKCSSWSEHMLSIASTTARAWRSLSLCMDNVWKRNENSVRVYMAGSKMHSAKHSMRLLSSLYVWSTGLVSKETSVRLWLLPLRLLHLRESRPSPSARPFTPPPKPRRFERCLSLCYHVLASYHLVCSPPTTFQPSLPFILLLVIFSPVTSNASS